MKKAILTGFEPFGPYKFNPTQDVARRYDGKKIGEIEISGIVLPCTYYGAFEILTKEIDRLNPDVILSTGLASRIKMIRIETTGKNLMNGKYHDAKGFQPDNLPIIAGENFCYRANLDASLIERHLREAEINSEISEDADGFVCNSLIYLTSRRICKERLPIKNTFFHAPWTDEYLGRIELEIGKVVIKEEDLRNAIEITINSLAYH